MTVGGAPVRCVLQLQPPVEVVCMLQLLVAGLEEGSVALDRREPLNPGAQEDSLSSSTRDAVSVGSRGLKDWGDSAAAAAAAVTAAAAAAAAAATSVPEPAEADRITGGKPAKAGQPLGRMLNDVHDVAAVAAGEAASGVAGLPWWQQRRCQVTLLVLLGSCCCQPGGEAHRITQHAALTAAR